VPAAASDVVRTWVRNLNERVPWEEGLSIVDPDFEMTESRALPGAAHVTGLEELRTYKLGWERNWSDWSWDEEELTEVAPGRVLLLATLRLRGKRSEVDVQRRWAYLFTVRDGRILRQDGYATREEAMASLEKAEA
jgi:ketosteroid isomerase-like protein